MLNLGEHSHLEESFAKILDANWQRGVLKDLYSHSSDPDYA